MFKQNYTYLGTQTNSNQFEIHLKLHINHFVQFRNQQFSTNFKKPWTIALGFLPSFGKFGFEKDLYETAYTASLGPIGYV